jgi:hypothetical protein
MSTWAAIFFTVWWIYTIISLFKRKCRLSDFAIDDNGISQMPFAVEATFPVGPIAVPISHEGRIDGEAQRIPRYSIQSAKGAEVRTDSFLNPLYENVSALIGCVKWDMLKPLPITVGHIRSQQLPCREVFCGRTKNMS